MAREECKNYGNGQANHPDGEEGAEDVDRRRACTAHEHGTERGNHNPLMIDLHLFGAPGGCGLVAGGRVRNRLPVTNSRLTAWRKSSERADTPESRANASCFSAVTTSTRFLTPYL